MIATNGLRGGGVGNEWLKSTSSLLARGHNSEVDEVCDTQILFTAPPPVHRASLPDKFNSLLRECVCVWEKSVLGDWVGVSEKY